MLYLSALIGGLSYRIRGGAFNEAARVYFGKPEGWEIPNGYIRWQWAIVMATLCVATTGNIALYLTTPLWFVGVTAGYFGGFFNLEDPSKRNPKNYLRLALRGAFIAAPYYIGTILLHEFYDNTIQPNALPVMMGAMLPVVYLVSITLQNMVKRRWGFSQIGEAIIGALIGIGVALG